MIDMKLTTILLIISMGLFSKIPIIFDSSIGWKIEVEVINDNVILTEPISINIKIKNNILGFDIPIDKWNYYFQIKRVGNTEWIDVTEFSNNPNQDMLSKPNVDRKRIKRNHIYQKKYMIASWKYYTKYNGKFEDMWISYEPGEYEVRVVQEFENGKKKYSETSIFNLVQPNNMNQFVIDYLSKLEYPAFLYHYYNFPSHIDDAIYISKELGQSSLSSWAKLYVIDHALFDREKFYSKNKAWINSLIEELSNQNDYPYIQERVKNVKADLKFTN